MRVAERPELEALLRASDPRDRPEPEQFAGAGCSTRVVGVRLETGEPRYRLESLPGFWREDWLRPV